MLTERNGTRKFEKISRWNTIKYTTITDKSTYKQYAEPSSSTGAKLWLNYFSIRDQWYPLRKFQKLDTPVMLSDLTRLSMRDGDLWLEVDEQNEKVRVYQEIACDGNDN